MIKDFVPLASLDSLEFAGWDLFPENAYDAAVHAAVLEDRHLRPIQEELSALEPMQAVFYPEYVKRLHGTHVKSAPTKADMVEAVRRCSERLKTGLLTNNVVTMRAEEMSGSSDPHASVLGLFDVIVESSRVGTRKPDPAFYEHACELLSIDPTEAVFLDDLGINLKPAAAMGMRTIKVGDPDVAIAELEAVIGFPLG